MRSTVRVAQTLLASTLICGTAAAQKVDYDFRSADFAQLKSFAVKEGEMPDKALVNERLVRAINTQLALKGLSRTSDPRVYIIPSVTTEVRRAATPFFNAGFGLPGRYGPYGWASPRRWDGPYRYYGSVGWDWGDLSTFKIRDTRYDTIKVDMVDARTGALLWRGTSVDRVNPRWKPEQIDKETNKVVAKIMKYYPPPVDD